ncbi:MAG TPA: ABC-2 family transporter protein [Polyangia bacterium]|jgi:ABC-2 type transport system permease protein
MRELRRYPYLFWISLRTSIQVRLQYRWDFLLEGVMAVAFLGLTLLPLWVFRRIAHDIPDWSFPEMLVITGWFTLLKGVIDGAVNPSLASVVGHIRTGSLDYVLLKPADAQFLVSSGGFDPYRMLDVVAGIGVCVWGFVALGRWPGVDHLAAALLLLGTACWVLYSTWILVVSAAFFVVRLDNLATLFMSIFEFGRWPVSMFRGLTRLVFTFVIPLALMTTYPTMALLGKLRLSTGLLSVAGAAVFAMMARLVWIKALGHYTSASS